MQKSQLFLFYGAFLWALGSVHRTAAVATFNAGSVVPTADDVVANTWQVLHTSATDHDDRVLLKVVTFTWNICGDFRTVRKTDTSHFTQSRVWLFWSHGSDLHTNATLEWCALAKDGFLAVQGIQRVLHRRRSTLVLRFCATLSEKLIDCWHSSAPSHIENALFKSDKSLPQAKKWVNEIAWTTPGIFDKTPFRPQNPQHTGVSHARS